MAGRRHERCGLALLPFRVSGHCYPKCCSWCTVCSHWGFLPGFFCEFVALWANWFNTLEKIILKKTPAQNIFLGHWPAAIRLLDVAQEKAGLMCSKGRSITCSFGLTVYQTKKYTGNGAGTEWFFPCHRSPALPTGSEGLLKQFNRCFTFAPWVHQIWDNLFFEVNCVSLNASLSSESVIMLLCAYNNSFTFSQPEIFLYWRTFVWCLADFKTTVSLTLDNLLHCCFMSVGVDLNASQVLNFK